MASKGFQIPGLTTLSQTQVPQTENASHAAPPSEPAQSRPSSAAADETHDSGDALLTTASLHDPNVIATVNGDAGAMEVDQHNPAIATTANELTAPPSPPSLTQDLEQYLKGFTSSASATEHPTQNPEENSEMQDVQDVQEHNEQSGHPEWEEDSSPYESSSDSSSSDDSDDEDDDSDDGKELLNPEELARMLMEAGSDDEGEGKPRGSASGAQLRTKNEQVEDVLPKPEITLTEESKLEVLGEVEHIIDNTIVVKAYTPGDHRVLDSGSALFTEGRVAFAALADLIGSVREPRYTARFKDDEDFKSYNLTLGSKVYYSPEHASFVFTEPLKSMKGTDASNLNDEEPGDDEMEFSDDEKEAAYKREQKEKRKARHGRGGGASGRGGRRGSHDTITEPTALKYDDDDDGPYRPLVRPANFGQGPSTFTHGSSASQDNGGSFRGGRGDFRGRSRARDRGARGNRGRGSGHSLPPRTQGYGQQFQQPPPQQSYGSFPHPPPQLGNQAYSVPPAAQFFGTSAGQGQGQGQGQGTQLPFPAWPQPPQNLPPNFIPPPPPQFQQQGGQAPTFYNPAFFSALQDQLQNHNQNQGTSQQSGQQWPHQGGSG
ncbi:hypothetical protein JX265_003339 [Neoarthrinium moseri]|uniref:H/ACA ribonucleoprotein complex non-core subunit NAF1 n=1 Tax=Neoarthrinium moseri TaxID=1658444 RepID=A0A9P9WRT2_9PEZI|nr:hypothetical protein JX265_003339 [Neoarthrinium moseri]